MTNPHRGEVEESREGEVRERFSTTSSGGVGLAEWSKRHRQEIRGGISQDGVEDLLGLARNDLNDGEDYFRLSRLVVVEYETSREDPWGGPEDEVKALAGAFSY
ncbi:unnamed protein product [Phytomonas sp. EM1]|nr:unnamed protein product [Phytomonas sp. EM1]|eukprot:CCW63897.1 unnamed protein product [Phytomonas sp. isolate EM1]